jgi:hypothetical protein
MTLADKDAVRAPAKPAVRRNPDETTQAALGIIQAELRAREKKTATLRALRLSQEQAQPPAEKKTGGRKKSVGTK